MFWGLIMEPHRRYTQKVKKAFHISMAALDISTSSEEPAQVMCGFEGRNYLLCTLKKPDAVQCPLNLNFDVGSEVSFAANGKCHIHLTGYLQEDFADLVEEEEDEEDDETVKEEQMSPKRKKRAEKTLENGPPSKKSKNGVVTSSQVGEDLDVGILLGKSLEEDDEDDEDAVVDEEEDGTEEEAEDEEEDVQDEEDEDEQEDEDDDEEDEESSLSEVEDEVMTPSKPNMNGLPSLKAKQKESEKKKKDKQGEQVKKSPQVVNEQKKGGKTPNKENQKPKKKSLQGGVIVEDIKEGQGAPAKNGKFVNVYYEGRLKQNNKMFDSATKGGGFSFRLGNSEVIKGWDVGVAGMKVGGKRRITCPPAMAYGQKGSPPAIPPNSTLVFEVELRKVN